VLLLNMLPVKANGMGETNVFPGKFVTAEKEALIPATFILQLFKAIESPPLLAVTVALAPLQVNVLGTPNRTEVAVMLTLKPE
jgi:hypothetical protein